MEQGAHRHLNVFAALQNTRRKSYYGSGRDPNAYGRTHDLVVTSSTVHPQFQPSAVHAPRSLSEESNTTTTT